MNYPKRLNISWVRVLFQHFGKGELLPGVYFYKFLTITKKKNVSVILKCVCSGSGKNAIILVVRRFLPLG